jgi:radical SAM modification target selenobiotic family peptide
MIFLFTQFFHDRSEAWFLLTKDKEVDMDKKELKKLLAGLSVASLIAGAGLSVTGCATA